MYARPRPFVVGLALLLGAAAGAAESGEAAFAGRYFSGAGDREYLELLDISRRMFAADPEYQGTPMLYTPAWNGFVEGPTWDAWWVQNSYGTTYSALPFYEEPYVTFLQNAQDLWFDQMGDGQRAGNHGYVAPDGSLCDAASPGVIHYRQGDGQHAMHDWGMEFTAAGLLMQAELLLISRDAKALDHYLPKLERCANFVESRRDPKNNLFLAGPAGNLLAPSYAGWKQADGTFEKAYLAGLSISYIAALDRLIELEKMANREAQVKLYSERRAAARDGLAQITTDEGYFIKSLDPDGTRHGVHGAEKHGYFEASPNHDAIAFRVVDDAQARKIYEKIAAIPGLRRYHVIIANEPSLDDMYDPGTSWLWKHGTWVNGGHWSTCEARMILGYYRVGAYDDARHSMKHILTFAKDFRMDNPLVDFGSKVYQPKEPINICYDTFGPPAAMIRGLFEYLYRADSLTLIPHIPPGIARLEQHFPIRFGEKRLFLSTRGTGKVAAVRINGDAWKQFDEDSVTLPYAALPDLARVELALGGAELDAQAAAAQPAKGNSTEAIEAAYQELEVQFAAVNAEQRTQLQHIRRFAEALAGDAGLRESYAARHAALVVDSVVATHARQQLLAAGQIEALPEASRAAADQAYLDTATRLATGLADVVGKYGTSTQSQEKRILAIWTQTAP